MLTYGEMATPVAGPGEVRIRLEASGVNPADVGRRGGSYRAMEFSRVIPNSDGAGFVDQIGDGVTRFKVGDRVWLFNGQRNGRAFGTAAEYIALAEHLVTPLPDNLSFAEGATLGIPAHDRVDAACLRRADRRDRRCSSPAAPARSVIMPCNSPNGAARKVIATVSSAMKGEQARRAGADLVVNYRDEDVVAKAMAFTGDAASIASSMSISAAISRPR